jgi:uncharacterized Zn ribbon protein
MNNRSNINIEELIKRIDRLEIKNRILRKDLNTSCIKTKTNKKVSTEPAKVIAKDAKGNVLEVGQRVKFITKGKYKSTEGIIEKIKETRVISIDNKKNKIVRAHQNVEIITRDGGQKR